MEFAVEEHRDILPAHLHYACRGNRAPQLISWMYMYMGRRLDETSNREENEAACITVLASLLWPDHLLILLARVGHVPVCMLDGCVLYSETSSKTNC